MSPGFPPRDAPDPAEAHTGGPLGILVPEGCEEGDSSDPTGPGQRMESGQLGGRSSAKLHSPVGHAVDQSIHPDGVGQTGIKKIEGRRSRIRSAMQEGSGGGEGLCRGNCRKKGAVAHRLELAGL